MRIQCCLLVLAVLITVSFAGHPSAQAAGDARLTRNVTVISSAGARALADACTAWAERNKTTVAMAILDWGGNVVESHAMEGAAGNAIDTALLKAKSSAGEKCAQAAIDAVFKGQAKSSTTAP